LWVFIFYIFSALAEFEWDIIKERTMAGLAAARARGKSGGRPKRSPKSSKVTLARKLYADKSNTVDEIYKTLNISRATLYRYIRDVCSGMYSQHQGKVQWPVPKFGPH
jgi:DNA invertase Pin-like site-specific DNA recombinase